MNRMEMIVWSVTVGTVLAGVFVTLMDVVFNRHQDARREGVSFLALATAWVFFVSGLAAGSLPGGHGQWVRVCTVLVGPLLGSLTCFRARNWLFTRERDRILDYRLLALGLLLLALSPLLLLLPVGRQLPVSATVICLGCVLFVGIAWRGVRLGDGFWGHLGAVAGLFALAASGMYYALISATRWPLGVQVVQALALCVSATMFCMMLWRRNSLRSHDEQTRRHNETRDPLTRLLNQQGFELRIRRYLPNQKNRMLRGALVVLSLRGMTNLYRELGQMGVNEVLVILAGRLFKRMGGGINAVCRWDDNHFVVLVDNVQNVRKLEKLINRTRDHLYEPMTVQGYPAGRVDLVADVSIGLLLLEEPIDVAKDVPRALHVAHMARGIENRCARMSNRLNQGDDFQAIESSGTSLSPVEAELRGGGITDSL